MATDTGLVIKARAVWVNSPARFYQRETPWFSLQFPVTSYRLLSLAETHTSCLIGKNCKHISWQNNTLNSTQLSQPNQLNHLTSIKNRTFAHNNTRSLTALIIPRRDSSDPLMHSR